MRKKILANFILGALLPSLLTGCGESSESISTAATEAESAVTEESSSLASSGPTVAAEYVTRYQDLAWTGTIQIVAPSDAVDEVRDQAEAFLASIPGLSGVTVQVTGQSESDAARALQQDPASADLVITTQEFLPLLYAAGAATALPEETAARVQTQNDTRTVEAATITTEDGESTLAAYPFSFDGGCLLYYDSSVITDPTSLSQILADCESAGKTFDVQLTSGWYQQAFFGATGAGLSYTTDADGTFTSCEGSVASDAGVTALKEMVTVAASSSFEDNFTAGNAENAAAIIDGYWDAPVAEALFGDNFACAKLPTFTGEDGTVYQMGGFSSCRLLCVTTQEDSAKQEVLFALAEDLSGQQAQKERYEELSFGPSNKIIQWSEAVQEDEALTALQEQQQFAAMEGLYPGDYWQLAATLGDAILNGEITEDSTDEELLSLLTWFEETCQTYTGM